MKILEFYQQYYTAIQKLCSQRGHNTKPLDEKSRSIQSQGKRGVRAMVRWAHPEIGKISQKPPRVLVLQLTRENNKVDPTLFERYVKTYPPFPTHPEVEWEEVNRSPNPSFYQARFPLPNAYITSEEDLRGFVDHHQTTQHLEAVTSSFCAHAEQLVNFLSP